MYAQVVTFEESAEQVQAGIDHVLDDVIPALETSPGLSGLWLVDREHGKRISIMVWESEAYASAAMAKCRTGWREASTSGPSPRRWSGSRSTRRFRARASPLSRSCVPS